MSADKAPSRITAGPSSRCNSSEPPCSNKFRLGVVVPDPHPRPTSTFRRGGYAILVADCLRLARDLTAIGSARPRGLALFARRQSGAVAALDCIRKLVAWLGPAIVRRPSSRPRSRGSRPDPVAAAEFAAGRGRVWRPPPRARARGCGVASVAGDFARIRSPRFYSSAATAQRGAWPHSPGCLGRLSPMSLLQPPCS